MIWILNLGAVSNVFSSKHADQLGVKLPGCEGEHSPPSRAEVTPTPPVCLHGMHMFVY